MHHHIHLILIAAATLLLPQYSYAQETLKAIITDNILPIFDAAIGFIIVLAVLAFIIGAVRFMYAAGDDKSRSDGRTMMVWGTIALFVMVSVWGIARIIHVTFFGS